MFANAHEIGRIVPTTPWDTVFGGIATWLGIKENDLDKVCPNLHNFDSSYLIDPEEMFDVIEVPPPAPSEAPQPYSPMPSMQPSDSPICLVNELFGATYYFVVTGIPACWRLQLTHGGTLEADFNDSTCSNNVFTSTGEYSLFDSVDQTSNVAVYKKGEKGYSGKFRFEESSNVTKTESEVEDWNPASKEFAVKLTIPSCKA